MNKVKKEELKKVINSVLPSSYSNLDKKEFKQLRKLVHAYMKLCKGLYIKKIKLDDDLLIHDVVIYVRHYDEGVTINSNILINCKYRSKLINSFNATYLENIQAENTKFHELKIEEVIKSPKVKCFYDKFDQLLVKLSEFNKRNYGLEDTSSIINIIMIPVLQHYGLL